MKKTLTMVLAFALVFALGVGGTLAWLTATTPEVKNTFTVGDINITLEETGMDNNRQKHYDYVPGDTLEKDPTVTVLAGSEKCYVFIKVVETGNIEVSYTENEETKTEKALQYEIDGEWIKYADGIYYQVIEESDADTVLNVLKDTKVEVSEHITKTDVSSLSDSTLTFEAAAVQYENIGGLDDAFAQTGF